MASTFNLSSMVVTAQAQVVAQLLERATIAVFEGQQPESADAPLAAVNRMLAMFVFPEGLAAVDGVVVFDRIADAQWIASGKPSFARVQKDGVTLFDCSVGVSNADILIDASPVAAGTVAHIVTGATYKVPK